MKDSLDSVICGGESKILILAINPTLSYVTPTPVNLTNTTNTLIEINVTINEINLKKLDYLISEYHTQLNDDITLQSLTHNSGTGLTASANKISNDNASTDWQDTNNVVGFNHGGSAGANDWISIDYESSRKISKFRIFVPDSFYASNVTLEASNDYSTWTPLVDSMLTTPTEWVEQEINDISSYRYYRVRVLEGGYGTSSGGYISEWELIGSGEVLIDENTILLMNMEDATDSSLHGNDGTVTGATLTTGKYGQGYYLDGINDYLSVPDSSDWDIPTGKDFTIGTW